MKLSPSYIIGIVVAALLMGILLPIALNDIMGFYSTDSTIMQLVGTVLPVIAVIALVLLFLPKSEKD